VLADPSEADMSKILIVVVAATLALAACGSSSKSGSSGTETTTTGGSSSDLATLAARAKTAAFKVTYETSNDRTVTIAQDGKGKQSVREGDNLYIVDGTTAVYCDGTTSSATCEDRGRAGKAAADAITTSVMQAYRQLANLNSSLFNGRTHSDTIAGRDATCVTVKASDMAGILGAIAEKVGSNLSGSMCLDNETGVLLKLSGGSEDSTTDVIVATEFGEPSDSDFQPPSTPKSVPSFTIPSIPKVTLPPITIPSG
jgi:hypothetical protein